MSTRTLTSWFANASSPLETVDEDNRSSADSSDESWVTFPEQSLRKSRLSSNEDYNKSRDIKGRNESASDLDTTDTTHSKDDISGHETIDGGATATFENVVTGNKVMNEEDSAYSENGLACPERKEVTYTDDGLREIPKELYNMTPAVSRRIWAAIWVERVLKQ